MLSAQQAYAEKNPTTAKELIQTMKDGRSYLSGNPQFLTNAIQTTFNVTDQGVVNSILTKELAAYQLGEWDDSFVSSMGKYLGLLQKYGAVKSVPSNLFSAAYNP